jgi:hypothetical protein
MVNGRRLISAVICALVITAVVHADMISVPQPGNERVQRPSVCRQLNFQRSNSTSTPYSFSRVFDLDKWANVLSSPASDDNEQSSEILPLQSFTTNGPGSLNLCLSALFGLGLCSSVHLVKKLSFNFVPEWYHSGGPFQIGHSHAVTPESLCPVADCCFIQPICTEEDYYTEYRLRTVISLWRKSQFTPAVIASRGPPSAS